MGAPKSKWTAEEEDALRAGIQKHGAGKWRTIQKDPEFSRCLAHRSNIDLKDKWRNLSVTAGGQSSREKVRMTKTTSLPATPSSSHAPAAPSGTPNDDGVPMLADSTISPQDGKGLRATALIMEALATMQDPNGSDIGAICHFIEERYEVPANFRRMVSSKLRRLVTQNKIGKVENRYKAKEPFGTDTPTPIERDTGFRPRLPTPSKTSQKEEFAKNLAYLIADAEAKSFAAAEAAKELERVNLMLEESEAILMLAKEIYEICSRGEVVSLI